MFCAPVEFLSLIYSFNELLYPHLDLHGGRFPRQSCLQLQLRFMCNIIQGKSHFWVISL